MLTEMQVREAKAAAVHVKLADSRESHLYLTPFGGKLWRYRYLGQGKEKLPSLGTYPLVSLAEARAARDRTKAAQRN